MMRTTGMASFSPGATPTAGDALLTRFFYHPCWPRATPITPQMV
jgi:hypothetical protein